MKTYLNSNQRKQFCQLAAMQGAVEEIISEWGAHDGLTFEERKYLRSAATMVKKSLRLIASRLAAEEGKRLLRTADATQCVCIPKESAEQFRRRIENEMRTDGVWVNQDAFDAIVEMALCRGCSPCLMQSNKEACPLWAAMMELDVPVYDSKPGEGGCPWEIT